MVIFRKSCFNKLGGFNEVHMFELSQNGFTCFAAMMKFFVYNNVSYESITVSFKKNPIKISQRIAVF